MIECAEMTKGCSFILMSFSVEYSPAPPEIHVIASRTRNICILRQSGFVDTFCSFYNLVKSRCNFRRRNATTKDVASRNWGTVKITICVLAFNKYGAF